SGPTSTSRPYRRRTSTWRAGSPPGTPAARSVLRHADRLAESPLESVVRGRCVLLELPMPRLQVWVDDFTRADFFWPEHGVVGEADGRVKYADADALMRERSGR